MSAGVFLLTMLGGGIGASLRFVLDGRIMRRVHTGYPWGTFVINTTGALTLGLLTGLGDSSVLNATWLAVLGSGAMGGYTVFSAAMVDTVHMLQKKAWGLASIHALGMLALMVLLAGAGLLVGRAL